jgi:hypothetical protein
MEDRPENEEIPFMAYHPFLAFSGFLGDLALLANRDAPAGSAPPGVNPNAIMHAAMTSRAGLLMGADDPSGNFDGQVADEVGDGLSSASVRQPASVVGGRDPTEIDQDLGDRRSGAVGTLAIRSPASFAGCPYVRHLRQFVSIS